MLCVIPSHSLLSSCLHLQTQGAQEAWTAALNRAGSSVLKTACAILTTSGKKPGLPSGGGQRVLINT